MMIFLEDMEITRSSPDMIASYSASLLKEKKFICMACSLASPVEDLSCSPRMTPVCREASSTFRVHQLELSGFISC